MKPHQLEIEAFGPYAEPVRIAFDALAREGLFLIHGPTGAGKTYLLDALCFALYGEVSGERSLKGLRSDHAAATAVPRVALEFSAAGRLWRVERSPACTLPKSRGTGTTSRGARAALQRLGADGAEAVARAPADVTREITELVGLDGARFRQVILLPQGRFAEVLRARTEEREGLLKTLFDTTLYERAMLWLDEQARQVRGGVFDGQRELEGLQEQAAHVAAHWCSGEVDDGGNGAADPALGSVPEPPDLVALVQRLEGEEAGCQAALDAASNTLEGARRQQADTLGLAERWDRRAAALQLATERQAQAFAIEALRQALAVAERAEGLRSSLRADAHARSTLAEGQRRLANALQQAERARERAAALPDALLALSLLEAPAPAALARVARALASRRTEVEALARVAEEAAALRRAAAAAAAEAQDAAARVAKGEQLLSEATTQRQAIDGQLAAARSSADRLDGLRRADADARQRLETLELLETARSRETQAREGAVVAEAAANSARAALLQLRERQ
ncbi:MAG: AAA family ATPase, partial [Cyanobium sp.]